MSNEEEQDVVIFDSSLTLEQLKGYWNYGDDAKDVKFSKEEIDKLAEDVNDAIHNTIEDFLNHRSD
jgi:hypothetical protein